jgi:hypothetical protein
VESYFPGNRIMAVDQRAGVVEEHLLWHPAVVVEGRLDPVKPSRLLLMPERPLEQPPRIAKGGYEQVEPHQFPADRHPRLAEIDLQLMPRRRLKT